MAIPQKAPPLQRKGVCNVQAVPSLPDRSPNAWARLAPAPTAGASGVSQGLRLGLTLGGGPGTLEGRVSENHVFGREVIIPATLLLDLIEVHLALQLRFCFEVSALSGSLVSPSPE